MTTTALPLSEAHVAGDTAGHVKLHNDLAHYVNVGALAVWPTTLSTSSTISTNFHWPANTTASTLTLTLPATMPALSRISAEKVTSDTNKLTLSGSLRGVPASTHDILQQHDTAEFIADNNNSWWQLASHRTHTGLKNEFATRASYSALDSGHLGWTFDPSCCSGTTATPTSGKAYYGRIMVPETISVTSVEYVLANTPSGLTAAFVGLYDMNGNLIGVSADQHTLWTAAAFETTALASGPFTVVGGPGVWVEAALLSVVTPGTQAQFRQGSGSGDSLLLNGGLAGPPFRVSSSTATNLTTLAGTKAACAAESKNIWFGLK